MTVEGPTSNILHGANLKKKLPIMPADHKRIFPD